MNHFGRVAAAGWVVVVEVVMRLECKCSQRERERERERWTGQLLSGMLTQR